MDIFVCASCVEMFPRVRRTSPHSLCTLFTMFSVFSTQKIDGTASAAPKARHRTACGAMRAVSCVRCTASMAPHACTLRAAPHARHRTHGTARHRTHGTARTAPHARHCTHDTARTSPHARHRTHGTARTKLHARHCTHDTARTTPLFVPVSLESLCTFGFKW